ncbi:MAG: hypothetical protein WC831_06345 [Parcubacteria group bacterium]|jgi:hypothetical protein
MIAKEKEKSEAVKLRKSGHSYNEILALVPVSKSTLSVWLRDLGIAKRQKQRLTLKRKAAQLKAQQACRQKRVRKEKIIIYSAKKESSALMKNDLWLMGVMLYWAEGSKQKDHNVSQRVTFSNSDPNMMILFDNWLKNICSIPQKDLIYSIYIHETADQISAKKYWEDMMRVKIERIYFKKNKIKTNRKNIGDSYKGLLRIDVRRSTDFNRKIKGWIEGIVEKSQKIAR